MIFGVDYYPEQFNEQDWPEHAKLLKEGGFNTVRMAEFAWSRLEPEEDNFDFSWLDHIIEILCAQHIKVILGTPTAAPPKWLVDKYDVRMRDKYGRPRGFGSRRACCSNHPYYIERCKIILEQMAARYGRNPNVIGWQIDNEFGCHDSTRCYCGHCQKKFPHWLKNRYHDIKELNQKYGTVFWSQEYRSFNDVILPSYTSCEPDYGSQQAHNPSLVMDFYRFSSDSWISFQEMQIKIIRRFSDYPITHNMMGHFSDIDYYKLGQKLDVVSWDNYIDNQWNHCTYETASMAHELMRGVKNKNFLVMEQQAGPCGWDMFGGTPRPGQLRLWTYQAIAHGCAGLLYFRFLSAPFGIEQYWLGTVDHDGVPRRRFFELQQTGKELERLSNLFETACSLTDVLIVKSYETVWSHKIANHVRDFDYRGLLYTYYKINSHIGTNPACGSADMISTDYKIVYIPAYSIVSDREKTLLEEYVKNGGTLVLTFRSGIKNENNNMVPQTLPGLLKALAGITVCEFDSSPVVTELSDGFGTARVWRDIIETKTAKPVVLYTSEYYRGTPAVTVNEYGSGRVWYIGCDMEEKALERLIKRITDEAGAAYISHPAETEMIKRRVKDSEYTMLLNYSPEEKTFDICGTSLINGKPFQGTLAAYGVEIIS